jgi:UDP-N-acetylmuramyl pentapeptide phosphotransferase/UDP-N-acetylglucosamine-1-phosphate transferase
MKFYLVLFIISFTATYIVRLIAVKMKIYDIPVERSSHTIPTPRGGGIALVISWYIGIIYEHLFWNSMPSNLFYSFLSGLIIVIIGLIDDIWSVNPKIKIIFQVIASLLALYFLGGLQKLDMGFLIFENKYILSLIALIGIVWAINLFNFSDGIDGYLGSEVAFISIAIGILYTNSMVLLLGSVTLGFLVWNWQKAKIFIGDVGSTLLGFNVAIFAIYYQNSNKTSILIWIMLSSVFWFDATLTLFRRFRNKENLSVAHRKHAYQRITQAGFSHQKTVIYSILINIIIFFFAWLSIEFSEYILGFLLMVILMLYFITKKIDMKMPFISLKK